MLSNKSLRRIKSLRTLTKLLGKLGIRALASEYPPRPNWALKANIPEVYYGWGLKESKDFTQKIYPTADYGNR